MDEIRFTDTIVCDDAIRMDDETLWESDEITITEMGEFLNPWCMMDDKAVELDCTFNKAPFGKTATLYREFETGDPGRRLYVQPVQSQQFLSCHRASVYGGGYRL